MWKKRKFEKRNSEGRFGIQMKKKRVKAEKKGQEPEIEARFAPVAKAFADVKGVKAGKLFASYGLKVNGKIFAMVGRGRLVVKLRKSVWTRWWAPEKQSGSTRAMED